MRARLFETAQLELEQISVALQRAYGRESSTAAKPKRRLKLPAFSFGQILYVLGLLLLGGVLLHPWQRSVDPLGDAKLNNAPPVKVGEPPSPTLHPVRLGDQFMAEMPDGRWLTATYVGQHRDWNDLPWTGNKVGDARYVWALKHWFIWAAPLTPANATPTWIDP
jgi:hypothetical protein